MTAPDRQGSASNGGGHGRGATPTAGRDVPAVFWLYLAPLPALVVLASSFFDWSAVCEVMRRRDSAGGGVLELGTPLVLLPGIWAAFAAAGRFGRLAHARFLRTWAVFWALACLYFAGEELSWGQWVFGWETPEAMRGINDQGETNLHNISNLFNQMPRAVVELFVLVGGLVLPLWREATGRALDVRAVWYWVLPTRVGTVAAAIWLAAQITDEIKPAMDCRFNDSELREFYIATFLSLYLLSIWRRAGAVEAAATPAATTSTGRGRGRGRPQPPLPGGAGEG